MCRLVLRTWVAVRVWFFRYAPHVSHFLCRLTDPGKTELIEQLLHKHVFRCLPVHAGDAPNADSIAASARRSNINFSICLPSVRQLISQVSISPFTGFRTGDAEQVHRSTGKTPTPSDIMECARHPCGSAPLPEPAPRCIACVGDIKLIRFIYELCYASQIFLSHRLHRGFELKLR